METKNKEGELNASLWKGSTLQLLGVIIFPLAILVLIFALGGSFAHQRAMRRMIGERDALAVSAAASTLSAELKHRVSAMQGLVLRASGNSAVPEEVLATSDYLMSDFDRGIALISADGQLLAVSGDADFWFSFIEQQNGDVVDWLNNQVGPDGEIMDTFIEPNTGAPLLFVAASSPEDQLFSVGALTIESLANQTLSSALPNQETARLFLVNRSRELLYESNSLGVEEDFATHPGVLNGLGGEIGTTYMTTEDDEHVVAYSPVEPVGWVLIIEESWQTVTTPFLRTTEIAPLALVPLLLISLAGLWFGVRQIVQPLRALETKASSLAWGDFQTVNEPVGGIAEIRRLQAELVHMASKVQSAQDSLHDYIGVITETQEEERRRLARELHDGTLQALIALKQRIQMVKKDKSDPTTKVALQTLESLAEQTIEDLRRTTRALRPIYLEDLGLVTALEMLGRETEEAAEVRVTFSLQGEEIRLSASVELALYRIAQEALSNVARHAQASQANLRIQYSDKFVELEIEDNGVGFEAPTTPADFAPSGHFGLLGMYERADLIGASLKIHSEAGQGTRTTIRLPIE